VGDVSVIHPGSATYCAAAAKTDGGAAAQRDADKTSQYRRYGAGFYRLVPLTVETCGRLGRPFMDLLTDVSSQASQHINGTFTREQFVLGVLRKLSVCLYRRNAAIERAVAGCFVRVSGGCCRCGLRHVPDRGDPAAPATAPQPIWLTRSWSAWHRRPRRALRLYRVCPMSHELGPSLAAAL
jgi:hypothetical protein